MWTYKTSLCVLPEPGREDYFLFFHQGMFVSTCLGASDPLGCQGRGLTKSNGHPFPRGRPLLPGSYFCPHHSILFHLIPTLLRNPHRWALRWAGLLWCALIRDPLLGHSLQPPSLFYFGLPLAIKMPPPQRKLSWSPFDQRGFLFFTESLEHCVTVFLLNI